MECNVYGVDVETVEVKTVEATVRPHLTDAQVELIRTVLGMSLESFKLEDMDEIATALSVAGELAKKAASVHRKHQVPWSAMCWAARLPCGVKDMLATQEKLEKMLGPLFVNLIRQEKPVRGCGLPNFEAAQISAD